MLNAESAFKGLFVFQLSNQFAIEPGANVRAFGFYFEMVPFLRFKQTLCSLVISGGLILAFGIEPSTHADTVNAARFGAIDFTLVPLGLALVANKPEAKARIEAGIFFWDFNFQFRHKIAQLQIADHPDIHR